MGNSVLFQVTLLNCYVHWCVPIFCSEEQRGPTVEEVGDDLQVGKGRRTVQWSPACSSRHNSLHFTFMFA